MIWSLEMIFFHPKLLMKGTLQSHLGNSWTVEPPPPFLKFTTWITKFNIAFCSLSKKKKEGGVFKVIRIIYILLGFPAHYNIVIFHKLRPLWVRLRHDILNFWFPSTSDATY